MIKKNEYKTTSLRVNKEKFEDCLVECIKYRTSFTNIVNNCLDLFINDPEFKNMIIKHQIKDQK